MDVLSRNINPKVFQNIDVEVLIIYKHNCHNFQSLMCQVATGGCEPDSVVYQVRITFRKYRNYLQTERSFQF